MRIRYFIEQAPDRFYDEADLPAAKARARRLSRNRDDGVYIIAEVWNSKIGSYEDEGSIVYYKGRQDAREGCCA